MRSIDVNEKDYYDLSVGVVESSDAGNTGLSLPFDQASSGPLGRTATLTVHCNRPGSSVSLSGCVSHSVFAADMIDELRFGRIEVRPALRQVLVDGRIVSLGSRAFDVMMALNERRDRLVSKEELMDVACAGFW